VLIAGPTGTGKSHLFQQVSPYAHLISGGKATVARMFVNNATGQRGLVCQYDVVCFDEVSGVSFDQKDGVNIMKGYMESGEFSRGKESIRADGSIVLVGNFDVDLFREFFQGLVNHAAVTLHIDNLRGDNSHHQIETVFKAFGRALRMAVTRDERAPQATPSTKGVL
jgi:uncharacterized protein (TIGR02688 family)